ncbi:TPA: hypothetical protein KE152_003138 [Klebsiella oxytoca]|nr:hypothetical protein [Klebsiella oxytoca]
MAEIKFPDLTETLPVWMNKGEPLTLAHASRTWWQRVASWLAFPLAQIDVDTCDEQLLALLAYQRDIERFEGESLDLLRLRVKYAFVNARDAGSIAGFARIFERLEIGQIQQLERQLQYEWDVILIRINDAQLTRDNTLMMKIIRQYGRTCRRYFFDVLTQQETYSRPAHFDCDVWFSAAELRIRPIAIIPDRVEVWVAPSQHITIGVTVLPAEAEDRTFTARPGDSSLCRVETAAESVTVYGLDWGETEITLTANDGGVSAVIAVHVVSAIKATFEYSNPQAPLFFTKQPEIVLIAYGDEQPGKEFKEHQSIKDAYISSRELEAGKSYDITIYNSDDVLFSNATTGYAANTALKLHYLVGQRTDIDHIFYYHNGLEEIAENAIYLPKIKSMVNAFHSTGVGYPPDDFMTGDMPDLADIEGLFRGSALRVLPAGFLRRAPNINTAYRAFAYVNFEKTPAGLFDACAENLVRVDWLFYQAKFPESDINDIFSANQYPNIGNVEYMAYMVTSLRGEGLKLIDKMQSATNTRSALSGATGLSDYADIPAAWRTN